MADVDDAAFSSRRAVSSFFSQLQDVADQLNARPVSIVVEVHPGRRIVEGWRRQSISDCLDMCAQVMDDYHLEMKAFEVNSAGYKLAWARNNVVKARDNSKRQWVKQDAVMRSEYRACSKLYDSVYPGHALPGYDTWRRHFLKLWHSDRALCLSRMNSWKHASDKGVFLASLRAS